MNMKRFIRAGLSSAIILLQSILPFTSAQASVDPNPEEDRDNPSTWTVAPGSPGFSNQLDQVVDRLVKFTPGVQVAAYEEIDPFLLQQMIDEAGRRGQSINTMSTDDLNNLAMGVLLDQGGKLGDTPGYVFELQRLEWVGS